MPRVGCPHILVPFSGRSITCPEFKLWANSSSPFEWTKTLLINSEIRRKVFEIAQIQQR
jgi:hypothetical protein